MYTKLLLNKIIMERIILLMLVCFVNCILCGQETFYYARGKKCMLTPIKSKTVGDAYSSSSDNYLETTGFLYVKLKSLCDKDLLIEVAKQHDLSIVEQSEFLPLWFVLKHTNSIKTKIIDIANSLYETGLFAECAPDFAMKGLEICYDPEVQKQWGLYNSGGDEFKEGVDINVSKAWNYATGRGVTIAIVDNGVELTHKDLAANIHEDSYDARTNTSPSRIYNCGEDSHGTHCAGIAAAIRNNGFGIAGVAPDARIMSISDALDLDTISEYTHARGIMWAWKHGADIISCSWKSLSLGIVSEAIDSALIHGRNGKGCVVIKSAGNDRGEISYPGKHAGVITVANLVPLGVHAEDSNYGKEMFISAPGVSILSTKLCDSIGFMSGTSMAAPHVAGVVALMLECNPYLNVDRIREIIAKTAQKLPSMELNLNNIYGTFDKYHGYGLINAHDAVIEAIKYIGIIKSN